MPKPPVRKAVPDRPSRDWIVPVIGVAIVFIMLVPIPAFLLDILLAVSITVSVLVLLVSMYIQR
ncbi:MAG: FHIPEP family type III secretion protein, partial [Terriglobia bacterium]